MEKELLNEILKKHKLWLENKGGERANLCGADLSNANLCNANLRDANLCDANLDFSCMPLWCGDLKANYDDKQIIQQLYHILSHCKNSKNCSTALKNALMTASNVKIANKFHRVKECGILESIEEQNNETT